MTAGDDGANTSQASPLRMRAASSRETPEREVDRDAGVLRLERALQLAHGAGQ